MIGLNRKANAHAKPNGKCPVDEALEALAREAQEVIEAVRERRTKREPNGTSAP